MRGWFLDAKKLTILTDISKDSQIILTDMNINLQIIIRFSPIFYPNLSEFIRFLSEFLRISPNFSDFPGFSSYLCTRKSAARKKGGGVIIFMKVLKNDEALPSEIDSRAFFVFCNRNKALSDYFRNFAAEIKTLRLWRLKDLILIEVSA